MVRILLGVNSVIGNYCLYRGKKMERSRRDVFEDMECFGMAISVFGGGGGGGGKLFDTR